MSDIKANIAYPSGLSSDLAGKLSNAASGAGTLQSSMSNSSATLSHVLSDMSTVINHIYTSSHGRSITALAGFWDGKGAIGSGGLGSGGVISDGSRAEQFMQQLGNCMPGVSGAINDHIAAISTGLSAISTVQSNPTKEWKPEEAASLQAQINSMVSALEAISTSMLSTSTAIEGSVSTLKLGKVCASGIAIGDGPGNFSWEFNPQDQRFLKDNGIDPHGTGGPAKNGGGGKPPGPPRKPPTSGDEPPPEESGGGKPWWRKIIDPRYADGTWRVIAGDKWRLFNGIPGWKGKILNMLFSGVTISAVNQFAASLFWGKQSQAQGTIGQFAATLAALGIGAKVAFPEAGILATGVSFLIAGASSLIHPPQQETPNTISQQIGNVTYRITQNGNSYEVVISEPGKPDVTKKDLTLEQAEKILLDAAKTAYASQSAPVPTAPPTTAVPTTPPTTVPTTPTTPKNPGHAPAPSTNRGNHTQPPVTTHSPSSHGGGTHGPSGSTHTPLTSGNTNTHGSSSNHHSSAGTTTHTPTGATHTPSSGSSHHTSPPSSGGTHVPPAAGSGKPHSEIVGTTHEKFEVKFWNGQRYNTSLVPPLELPQWLHQHGMSSITVTTGSSQPPVTSSAVPPPEVHRVVNKQFEITFWDGKHYASTLVDPLELPHWLEEHDATSVTFLACAPTTPAVGATS